MKEKIFDNKKNLVIICFLIIALIFLIIRFVFSDVKQNRVEIVKSSSKFYTVSNCVDRYLKYLYSGDIDNILLLLNSSYKRKNSINQDNLFDKISKFDIYYSFIPRIMYQEEIDSNVVKYYVMGILIPDDMSFDFSNKKDFYIIVYLDLKNSTYNIEPYDGEIFIKEDSNER